MDNKKEHIRTETVSSIIENRMPLFWGLNRKSLKSTSLYKEFFANGGNITIKKDDYTLCIRNKLLTQTHKDILEVLLCMRDNKLVQSFNMYDIYKVLDKKSKNVDWLEEIIIELSDINIEISYDSDPNHVKVFGIINELEYERTRGEAIVFWNESFISIYDTGAVLSYSKYLIDIANLNHDITKQVVRWMLTFPNLQIDLRNLMVDKLGLAHVVKSRSIYNYIKKIKEEDLSIFGIVVSDDKNPIISISRVKSEVQFYNGDSIQEIERIKKKKKKLRTSSLFDLD
jgi:hypothetical protein